MNERTNKWMNEWMNETDSFRWKKTFHPNHRHHHQYHHHHVQFIRCKWIYPFIESIIWMQFNLEIFEIILLLFLHFLLYRFQVHNCLLKYSRWWWWLLWFDLSVDDPNGWLQSKPVSRFYIYFGTNFLLYAFRIK